MMKYDGNMKDDYRLAKVCEVFKDGKGLVRTVRLSFRKRDKREPAHSYWKKPLSTELVPVQRLALLQASDEPLPSGTPEDNMPLDVEKRLVEVKAALSYTAART